MVNQEIHWSGNNCCTLNRGNSILRRQTARADAGPFLGSTLVFLVICFACKVIFFKYRVSKDGALELVKEIFK